MRQGMSPAYTGHCRHVGSQPQTETLFHQLYEPLCLPLTLCPSTRPPPTLCLCSGPCCVLCPGLASHSLGGLLPAPLCCSPCHAHAGWPVGFLCSLEGLLHAHLLSCGFAFQGFCDRQETAVCRRSVPLPETNHASTCPPARPAQEPPRPSHRSQL